MNTGGVHGSALGADEVAATKKVLGFDPEKDFEVARGRHHPHPRAGGPRQGGPRRVAAGVRRLGGPRARAQEAAGPAAGRGTARRLGRRPDVLGTRLQAAGHPCRVRPGAQRRRAETAGVVGRLSGSGRQQQHHHQGREVLRPAVDLHRGLHRRLVRPRAALRHPRARDGIDSVRHRAARADPRLRRHLPAVLRLHAAGGAAGVTDGHRHHLHLDARLDRPRRGRSDASAHRAPGGIACHSAFVGGAPGRSERDRLCMAHHRRARRQQRPGRFHPDPTGHPCSGGHQRRRRREGRLRAGRRQPGR